MVYICGTVECVVDRFLDGEDAMLGGVRRASVYSKGRELYVGERSVAIRYEDYVALHPVGFIPGSYLSMVYGMVVGRAVRRTALVHVESYACVPRVRVYMAVGKVVDLSLTWPVRVYALERRVEGLELCPEMLEINHLLTAWALGYIRASEVVSSAHEMGYSIGLLKGDFDGGAVLERLNVDGSPVGSFYLCDPRGESWVGVVSRWVRCGATSVQSGCAEAVRPFEGLGVPDDVEILLKRIRGNPSAAQLADDML